MSCCGRSRSAIGQAIRKSTAHSSTHISLLNIFWAANPLDGVSNLLDRVDQRADVARDIVEEVDGWHFELRGVYRLPAGNMMVMCIKIIMSFANDENQRGVLANFKLQFRGR